MADVKVAKALLEEATKDCQTASDRANQYGQNVAVKKSVVAELERLSKLPEPRKTLLAKDLSAIRTKLEQATAKEQKEKKPDEAAQLIKDAQQLLEQARIKSELHAGLNSPAPNPAFIKLLVKESGGPQLLDDMVAQMDDKTNRNVLEAALEARFDVELQQFLSQYGILIGDEGSIQRIYGTADKKAPDKSVKRVYELLLKVPAGHAGKGSKVERIRRFQEDTGGTAYGDGEIDLNAGRAGAEGSHNQAAQLCSPMFFPDGVDEDCQPPDDARKKEVPYFDWATLHEVGHEVDDKNEFMKKNQSDPKFGCWIVHGKNVTEPAKAAQEKFKYDLAYITERSMGTKPPPAKVDPPAGQDPIKWEQARKDFEEWRGTVMGLRLWWDGEACKRVAIGRRVYQLSYSWPEWVSYELDARKKGIHGYQFRAPGEWFAELYAAYYMGMLKPEHPAVKEWLPAKLK